MALIGKARRPHPHLSDKGLNVRSCFEKHTSSLLTSIWSIVLNCVMRTQVTQINYCCIIVPPKLIRSDERRYKAERWWNVECRAYSQIDLSQRDRTTRTRDYSWRYRPQIFRVDEGKFMSRTYRGSPGRLEQDNMTCYPLQLAFCTWARCLHSQVRSCR